MMTEHDGQEFSKAARVQQTGDIQSRLTSVKKSKIPTVVLTRRQRHHGAT